MVLGLEALIYILGLEIKPKCLPRQVVELISSAIGDVVQGLYYENCNTSEVKCLFLLFHFHVVSCTTSERPPAALLKAEYLTYMSTAVDVGTKMLC